MAQHLSDHSAPESDLDQLSTVQLMDRLTTQVSTLVRTELSQAVSELKSKGTTIGIGVGLSGAGAILALFGLGALIATVILAIAIALPAWLSALIVGVAILALAAVLAVVGAGRARSASPPTPDATMASVRADVDAVQEGLR
ncbi:phage holin family protein [Skermania sp. ID1734]|uniref:phage holin family protein n=1 Tax=Skermania sp. ID1734 TaxID=2597516 RepID=UPI0011806E25|nr:phage holin family protein [Skermania sp. ID1734]TSD99491.1 phage holin family protein [Skermania sp. ID1734]